MNVIDLPRRDELNQDAQAGVVGGGTDVLRLLARVSHNQAESGGDDLGSSGEEKGAFVQQVRGLFFW